MSTPNEGKKPITPSDLMRIRGVSDPQISPDGRSVTFVASVADMDENKMRTDIWVVPASGGAPNKITDDGSSSNPRWSPDSGTIAFYSSKEGKELCLIKPDGSDRKVIAPFETSNAFLHRAGESLAWAPDGSAIAYLATDEPKPDHEDIVVMERLMMKHLTGFMDFRRTHVFVVSARGGEARKLTSGDHDDHSICWSADGREVVFVSDRGDESDLFVGNDLWAVSAGPGEERRITSTLGAAYKPNCSPDGRWIAYLSTTRPDTSNDSVHEDSHLWTVSMDGEGTMDLVGELDRPCFAFAWAPDSSKVLFTAGDRGRVPLFSVSPEGGVVSEVMSGDWQFYRRGGFSVSKDGKVAFLKTDDVHPPEVYVASVGGSGEMKLTGLNDGFVEEFSISGLEPFWFTSLDGLRVKGYVARPRGYEAGKKYPVVLCVHGGPHGMFGHSFDERVQVLTSAGYAVVMVDPRGSSGFGQAFSDGCVLNWGGGDYQDLMLGLDHALENHDFLDPERQLVTGGSYGGYMTNWIVTQTDRFKAAVSRACVTNLLSFYGESAVSSLIEQEFNGLPYDNLSLLAQWSPVTHARNVRTPILFLHGEADFTCPIGQSEEMFKAVKRLGVDTMLVRYQGEGHGIRKKPTNKIDYYQRHLDWFAKYLE